jgi:hypothetical protein
LASICAVDLTSTVDHDILLTVTGETAARILIRAILAVRIRAEEAGGVI